MWLTNPRNARHHGEQQNFKRVTWPTMPLLWLICHFVDYCSCNERSFAPVLELPGTGGFPPLRLLTPCNTQRRSLCAFGASVSSPTTFFLLWPLVYTGCGALRSGAASYGMLRRFRLITQDAETQRTTSAVNEPIGVGTYLLWATRAVPLLKVGRLARVNFNVRAVPRFAKFWSIYCETCTSEYSEWLPPVLLSDSSKLHQIRFRPGLFRRGDAMPRKTRNFGVLFLIENALLIGPYTGMDFAMKNRFGLNFFLYREVKQNSISYY